MNALTGNVARYLYGLPFGFFGLFHFINGSQMAGMVPIPGGIFWIYLTGLALIAACISILIEKQTRLACILLGCMLIIFVLSIHLPGVIESGGEDANAMSSMLKDLALAGGAWILAGKYPAAENPAE